MDFEADITRADVVLAMYYFVTTYVGKDVKDSEAAKSFDDFKKLVSLDSKIYRAYSSGVPETLNAWNWALDSGIVEAYSDNTLRPDATLTRAEFATMLTRFMDYVK